MPVNRIVFTARLPGVRTRIVSPSAIKVTFAFVKLQRAWEAPGAQGPVRAAAAAGSASATAATARRRSSMSASLRSRHETRISSWRVQTCYRHPDRETGVSCSSCGRPICPDCMTPTPVGMRCPECARQRTKVRTARTLAAEPTLTYILIGICVVLQIGESLSGAGALSGGLGGSELFRKGALFGPAVADGQVWRVLTAGFLHAGIFHL